MAVTVRTCSTTSAELGEGPLWDARSGRLLWVDILRGEVHRATVTRSGALCERAPIVLHRHVGAIAPVAGGGYVAAAGRGFVLFDEHGIAEVLGEPEPAGGGTRMNDGATDPHGRFWAGSMAYDETPGAGSLHRLELDGTVTTVLRGLTISNGIDWSPDGGTMYLPDSGPGTVTAFSFDPATGDISQGREIVRSDDAAISPDGLTVDAEGDLWVAMWGGSEVRRYAAGGTLKDRLHVPAPQPTSCSFGGPGLATLFVTTARIGLGEAPLAAHPDSGRVFRVDGLDARGRPTVSYGGEPANRRPRADV
jgi:sugar lactone lactonase YvrE